VRVLALILSAVAVGLDNFAASIGIGLAGVDARTRWRVAVVFGAFEAGMPLIGLLLGHGAADTLGRATQYAGGALLALAGLWALVEARRSEQPTKDSPGYATSRLLIAGFALSVDNLVVGFGLGVTQVPLLAAVITFALTSVGLSLAGLELGQRVGARTQGNAELFAGAMLLAVGVLIAVGVL
jgi:putative Mn2+ efflux pump MntP